MVLVVTADDEDGPSRQGVGDGVDHRYEVGPDDDHLGLGVVDDELDLRRSQPPVDVDADGVEQRGAVEHLEVLDAVLVEEGDVVAAADAGRLQAGGDATRALVQLGPRDLPIVEDESHLVGALAGVRAQDVSDVVDPHGPTVGLLSRGG